MTSKSSMRKNQKKSKSRSNKKPQKVETKQDWDVKEEKEEEEKKEKEKKEPGFLTSLLDVVVPEFILAEESPLVEYFMELSLPLFSLGDRMVRNCFKKIATLKVFNLKSIEPLQDFNNLNLEPTQILNGLKLEPLEKLEIVEPEQEITKETPKQLNQESLLCLNRVDSAETLVPDEAQQICESQELSAEGSWKKDAEVEAYASTDNDDLLYTAGLKGYLDKLDAEELEAEQGWITPMSRSKKRKEKLSSLGHKRLPQIARIVREECHSKYTSDINA